LSIHKSQSVIFTLFSKPCWWQITDELTAIND
jgi:hypothetical protein